MHASKARRCKLFAEAAKRFQIGQSAAKFPPQSAEGAEGAKSASALPGGEESAEEAAG